MIESKTLTTALSAIDSGSIPLLDVSLPNNPNIKTGSHVARADTQTPPTFSAPTSLSTDTTYLIACLDLDAPLISVSFLSPLLHLLQPGVKVSNGTVTYAEEVVASWHPANPPPGAPAHRYVFLVYEQPEGFASAGLRKKDGYGLTDRVRFRWDDFERENGLGKVLAGNYFLSN